MKTNLKLMIMVLAAIIFIVVITREIPRGSESFTFTAEELSKALYLPGCWQIQLYVYPYNDSGKTIGEQKSFTIENPTDKEAIIDALKNVPDSAITVKPNLPDTIKPVSHMLLLKYTRGADLYGEYSEKTNQLLIAYPVLIPEAGPGETMYSKAVVIQMDDKFKETITNISK